MSRVGATRVSYADLCQQSDDGRRYELYDGEVVVVPSPLPLHPTDRGKKMQLLARHHITGFWIVDPDAERVEVYQLEGDRYRLVQDASGEAPIDSPLLGDLDGAAQDLFVTSID